MKKILLFFCLSMFSLGALAQPKFTDYSYTLNYFLPKTVDIGGGEVALEHHFNEAIPTPKEVLGFEIGERYCEWSDVLHYMEVLDKVSDRIKLVELGRTYEKRRFVQLVISSPENHAKLDQIKAEHLSLVDPSVSASLDTKQMPLVADLTCSMHGNEASGVNSSLVLAYLFAASEDKAVLDMLDKMVILLLPGANPDGINRFATWCNSTAGDVRTLDPSSYEYQQPWPSSRLNHYWADVNRDLLMCQHPEGRVGVTHYLEWHPNLVLDLHEKRSKVWTSFHSPGHPHRLHPYVTRENQSLTGDVGKYISKALKPIGANPYSGKEFDDLYIGKGAAYGDVHGSVCLLFEQPNTINYWRDYDGIVHTIADAIRNQSFASIGALCAGYDMRETLLNYQRDFFRNSVAAAEQSEVQGYVFQLPEDHARAYHLLENLGIHKVDVYNLAKDVKVGKQRFVAGEAYVIPLKEQRYYYKTKALFERLGVDKYEDKKFYDISTWTFPLAFNVAHAELSSTEGLLGAKSELKFPEGEVVGGKSDKAYLFGPTELYSFNIVRALLKEGVAAKVVRKPFKVEGRKVERGAVVVEVEGQILGSEAIYALLAKSAKENGVKVYAVNKLKSDKLELTKVVAPKVAMVTGNGMNASCAGEVRLLLDRHYGIAPSLLASPSYKKKELDRYNVLIVPDGAMGKRDRRLARIKEWVQNGGTLITIQEGYKVANRAGLTHIERLPAPKDKSNEEQISGTIMNATLDVTSPVGYGYVDSNMPVMKRGRGVFAEPKDENSVVPLRYTKTPYLSGYISQNNIERIASTPAAIVVKCGEGRVICFADDINFRSYWYGASKMMMNAVYFGYLY